MLLSRIHHIFVSKETVDAEVQHAQKNHAPGPAVLFILSGND